MRIKRELLDALAEAPTFPVPQSMVDGRVRRRSGSASRPTKAGQADEEDKGKDEDTLKAEYRAIAERRVRLGLLLSEIGRANGIQVAPDEMTRAMRAEAGALSRPGAQVMEFFRKNPQAAESLRGPIFEDKVVDFILELAKVEDRTVTPDELAAEPGDRRRRLPDPGQAGGACAGPDARVPAYRRPAPNEGLTVMRDRDPVEVYDNTLVPDGGRADRPRRARVRHLLPPAEGADHLPDRPGLRPGRAR